jgi:hypothetical protein
MMILRFYRTVFLMSMALLLASYIYGFTYPVVDTGTQAYYNNSSIITAPAEGMPFYGQDAFYQGFQPSYTDNGDGTITDNVTGLMWQKDMGARISYNNARAKADTLTLAGYTDWRMPTIKELYSLIVFTGQANGENVITPFIDTDYFVQPLGSPRPIDAQTWSQTKYLSLTMVADSTVFGVNFLDGRIKGYAQYVPGSNNTVPNSNLFARMVRGNTNYGINLFSDNGDGTITDHATGLMWQQSDDGIARDWQNSLAYAENLELADFTDWRLPNAKELQSIVDYNRCPDITNSAALDPLFSITTINDPDGNPGQYPYFWTGTTHLDGANPYTPAVYIAFGEAQGRMNGILMDVHGAGAQRSDPKTGNPNDYPQYQGPQGDVRYVFNYTRCVRNATFSSNNDAASPNLGDASRLMIHPNPMRQSCEVSFEIKLKTGEQGTLAIYNLRGQQIKTFQISLFTDKVVWNGRNEHGEVMSTGMYLCSLSVPGYRENRKLMIIK